LALVLSEEVLVVGTDIMHRRLDETLAVLRRGKRRIGTDAAVGKEPAVVVGVGGVAGLGADRGPVLALDRLGIGELRHRNLARRRVAALAVAEELLRNCLYARAFPPVLQAASNRRALLPGRIIELSA